MAAKKKIKEKQTKSTKFAGKKLVSTKKRAKKSAIFKKKSAKKKPARKKAAAKTTIVGKKIVGTKAVRAPKRRARRKSQTVDAVASSLERSRARSGGQAGDLQGLSNASRADSESVDELLEEGNAFEADAVAGVEQAGDADETEVHTHEVPEDDVPGEYLDKE
jgi:hypothetical protein